MPEQGTQNSSPSTTLCNNRRQPQLLQGRSPALASPDPAAHLYTIAPFTE